MNRAARRIANDNNPAQSGISQANKPGQELDYA
jgi:hypothetical protein